MTNHMHVSLHFPEAYEGVITVNDREYSIAEMATAKELPPILKRFGLWAVTPEGIHCLDHTYFIAKDRLKQDDWYDHMEAKTWVNMSDFSQALNMAREFVRLEII